ncbi:hypothetical protein DFH06DRAFT_1324293 [Mycena polygramma]|nr:hypothetical protein DFH06DRAFT_1324293 [Mycena polygramma]
MNPRVRSSILANPTCCGTKAVEVLRTPGVGLEPTPLPEDGIICASSSHLLLLPHVAALPASPVAFFAPSATPSPPNGLAVLTLHPPSLALHPPSARALHVGLGMELEVQEARDSFRPLAGELCRRCGASNPSRVLSGGLPQSFLCLDATPTGLTLLAATQRVSPLRRVVYASVVVT